MGQWWRVVRPASRDPQPGPAGTKAERGHCPRRRRTEVDLWSILMPLRIRKLLRTRMSALRCTDTKKTARTCVRAAIPFTLEPLCYTS